MEYSTLSPKKKGAELPDQENGVEVELVNKYSRGKSGEGGEHEGGRRTQKEGGTETTKTTKSDIMLEQTKIITRAR